MLPATLHLGTLRPLTSYAISNALSTPVPNAQDDDSCFLHEIDDSIRGNDNLTIRLGWVFWNDTSRFRVFREPKDLCSDALCQALCSLWFVAADVVPNLAQVVKGRT